MYIVHVLIDVKEDCVEAFKEASVLNVKNSLQEKGVARFELLQSQERVTQFMLVEQYYSQKDQLAHRDTVHYAVWKETITSMLQKPYTFCKFHNISPEDKEW